jgi:hypothetical protein
VLVHAALCLTNYFGFVYSGALLVAQVIALWRRPRVAFRAAGSIGLGWCVFLPWIPAFRNHTALGGEAYWTPHPYLPQLFEVYGLQQYMGFTALVLAGAAAAVETARARALPTVPARLALPRADPSTADARLALRMIALTFALVPLATWVFSQSGTSLFLQRYLFPSLISFAVLWAEIVRTILDRAGELPSNTRHGRFARFVPCTLFAGLALMHVSLPLAVQHNRPAVSARVDDPFGNAELPIVVEHAHDYLHYVGYSTSPESYVFVVDDEFTRSPQSPQSALCNQIIILALARHYPRIQAVPANDFLERTARFIVVDSPKQSWFDLRILEDDRFTVEALQAPGRYLVTNSIALAGNS